MVKRFYEQKFAKAKKAADRDLANFITTTQEELQEGGATEGGEEGAEIFTGLMQKLKDTASSVRNANAEELQAGRLREGVRSAWECMWRAMSMEDSSETGCVVTASVGGDQGRGGAPEEGGCSRATRTKILGTKLLWILSKVNHRCEYLVRERHAASTSGHAAVHTRSYIDAGGRLLGGVHSVGCRSFPAKECTQEHRQSGVQRRQEVD